MKILFTLLIFFIVLFFYIHILFQLKTSNDSEIYELNQPSKDKLEKIFSLKQPFLFTIENNEIFDKINFKNLSKEYSFFDLKIRNLKEKSVIKYLPLSCNKSLELLTQDKKGIYFSEKNKDFLKETELEKYFFINDDLFRPPLLCNTEFDILLGSKNSYTPLRYEISYCNYILVNEGEINLKLCAPKNSKYLLEEKDYENMEFYSPINPWNINHKYKPDIDKVQFLDIKLKPKQIFFIPPYWWYSIQFQDNTNIFYFKYFTIMNNITISPSLFLSFLQKCNIKHKTLKKIEMKKKKNEKYI
jgi:hypothetical protein